MVVLDNDRVLFEKSMNANSFYMPTKKQHNLYKKIILFTGNDKGAKFSFWTEGNLAQMSADNPR